MNSDPSSVWATADLANIMAALESADPGFAPAYDALRAALGIEPPLPTLRILRERVRREHYRLEAQVKG